MYSSQCHEVLPYPSQKIPWFCVQMCDQYTTMYLTATDQKIHMKIWGNQNDQLKFISGSMGEKDKSNEFEFAIEYLCHSANYQNSKGKWKDIPATTLFFYTLLLPTILAFLEEMRQWHFSAFSAHAALLLKRLYTGAEFPSSFLNSYCLHFKRINCNVPTSPSPKMHRYKSKLPFGKRQVYTGYIFSTVTCAMK